MPPRARHGPDALANGRADVEGRRAVAAHAAGDEAVVHTEEMGFAHEAAFVDLEFLWR